MILPISAPNTTASTSQSPSAMPSRTYRVDRDAKTISGMVDGQDAMLQAYDKILTTERYAWEIYDQEYGVELENLIGSGMDYVKAVLKNRISDAFSADDRTVALADFSMEQEGKNTLTAIMTAQTVFGSASLTEEVTA